MPVLMYTKATLIRFNKNYAVNRRNVVLGKTVLEIVRAGTTPCSINLYNSGNFTTYDLLYFLGHVFTAYPVMRKRENPFSASLKYNNILALRPTMPG